MPTQFPGDENDEPFNTILRAFSSYGDLDFSHFHPLVPYLERLSVPEGHVLWKQGDSPDDGLYLIESGVLRARYKFAGEHAGVIEESMVPGTLAGELTALSTLPRNATAVVEKAAVLWRLSVESLRQLQNEYPDVAANFIQLVLKCEHERIWLFKPDSGD